MIMDEISKYAEGTRSEQMKPQYFDDEGQLSGEDEEVEEDDERQSTDFFAKRSKMNEDERLRRCRERNRIHARNTRERKKQQLDTLQMRIESLFDEKIKLSSALEIPDGDSSVANILVSMGTSIGNGRDIASQAREQANMTLDKLRHDVSALLTGEEDDCDVDQNLLRKDKSSCSSAEIDMIRRERNRMHAKKTRMRKKKMLQEMEGIVAQLDKEILELKHAVGLKGGESMHAGVGGKFPQFSFSHHDESRQRLMDGNKLFSKELMGMGMATQAPPSRMMFGTPSSNMSGFGYDPSTAMQMMLKDRIMAARMSQQAQIAPPTVPSCLSEMNSFVPGGFMRQPTTNFGWARMIPGPEAYHQSMFPTDSYLQQSQLFDPRLGPMASSTPHGMSSSCLPMSRISLAQQLTHPDPRRFSAPSSVLPPSAQSVASLNLPMTRMSTPFASLHGVYDRFQGFKEAVSASEQLQASLKRKYDFSFPVSTSSSCHGESPTNEGSQFISDKVCPEGTSTNQSDASGLVEAQEFVSRLKPKCHSSVSTKNKTQTETVSAMV